MSVVIHQSGVGPDSKDGSSRGMEKALGGLCVLNANERHYRDMRAIERAKAISKGIPSFGDVLRLGRSRSIIDAFSSSRTMHVAKDR